MNDSITNNSPIDPIDNEIKPEYDLAKMKCRPNPFAKRLGQQLTLSLDAEIVDYFETAAREQGISCQELMVRYLQDCAVNNRPLSTELPLTATGDLYDHKR
ncbi:MAG: hypothetical protein VKJ64_19180 [Leptolyngbyaceae bacterium]|nr:hypothetical protein [Leptolyngbyaceae bacterium]